MKNLFRKSLLTAAFCLFTLIGFASLATEPVDINNATTEQLAESLKGIGKAKAEAIVNYRMNHGPFKSVEELANVKGIGQKTLEQNRDKIKIGVTAPLPITTPKATK